MDRRPHPLHASPLRPCPYLSGQSERVIATELAGPDPQALYAAGMQAGFRRSHNFMYRPACPACDACRPVRVRTREFTPSRSLSRVTRTNRDLIAQTGPAQASTEQYGLFTRYQSRRHPGGGMDRMSFVEYRAMLETSPIETLMTEFRDGHGDLLAMILTDQAADGVSAVYSFFDPALPKRALGTYMILWLIDDAARKGLPYLYLGYWIEGYAKIDYKARFRPLEVLGPQGWMLHAPADGEAIKETV
jgi:arginyl-tRNA--protein-N-Asp/Glu arginylyltransferase